MQQGLGQTVLVRNFVDIIVHTMGRLYFQEIHSKAQSIYLLHSRWHLVPRGAS
eukprot:SAG11_NODE_1440_length_4905_cov_6.216188_4_plen_53_part_00